MFKKLRIATLLLSFSVLASVLTACGEKEEEPAPTPPEKEHKVEVHYTLSNLRPSGVDLAYDISILFTKAIETSVIHGVEGTGTGRDEERGIVGATMLFKESDRVQIAFKFPNVHSEAQTRALPATTYMRADIWVDGEAKKTVILNGNSAFDWYTGKLQLKRTYKVGDLAAL